MPFTGTKASGADTWRQARDGPYAMHRKKPPEAGQDGGAGAYCPSVVGFGRGVELRGVSRNLTERMPFP